MRTNIVTDIYLFTRFRSFYYLDHRFNISIKEFIPRFGSKYVYGVAEIGIMELLSGYLPVKLTTIFLDLIFLAALIAPMKAINPLFSSSKNFKPKFNVG